MTIQRVLHLNQNVSLHHRLSSSPFLFMFFFFFFFFLFFWDSCKGFCLFDQKKRKKEKSFFLRFSSLSFLVLSGAFERDKKKESSFFSSTIWREQTNEREYVAEIEKCDRRKSPKRRRSIEEGTFPFLLCRFVFLFLIRMLFRFERRERKGNHQKRKTKKGKKKFSRRSKKFGFLFFFFFFFLFQKRAAKERRGLQNKFWIVSKTFIAQL